MEGGVDRSLPNSVARHKRYGDAANTWWSASANGRSMAVALVLTVLFSGLGIALNPWLGEGYASLIFVVGISIIGALHGMTAALISAVLGALLFNYFVSDPVFEITMTRATDLAPPIVFMLCAVISGWLSGRLKDEALRASRSNAQLEGLLDISRQLQRVSNAGEVRAVLAKRDPGQGGRRLGLYRASHGAPVPVAGSPLDPGWLALAAKACLGEYEWLAAEGLLSCRLMAGQKIVGVLIVERAGKAGPDIGFLMAQGRMAALALERIDLALLLTEAHAAARTEELKTALLASVSHDLRSPLTAISASAAGLLAFGDQYDRETSRELLAGIVEESSRLNHLTNNLLQLTRLQAGDEGLHWSVLPVAEALRAIIGRKQHGGIERQITLSAAHEELLVEADATLFDLALTNVLQNAVRYSAPETEIIVACRAEQAACVITVTDDGIGIPETEQARVFERFYRVQREDRGPRGTGLGLAIARGFVEASGGSIVVTSPVRNDAGTMITIRLPLTDKTP